MRGTRDTQSFSINSVFLHNGIQKRRADVVCFSRVSPQRGSRTPRYTIRNGFGETPQNYFARHAGASCEMHSLGLDGIGRTNVLSPHCFSASHFPHPSWPPSESSGKNSIRFLRFPELISRNYLNDDEGPLPARRYISMAPFSSMRMVANK